MADYFTIRSVPLSKEPGGPIKVFPDFIARRSKDLLVAGGVFQAVYIPETGLWSRNIYHLINQVDSEVKRVAEKLREEGREVVVQLMENSSTNLLSKFVAYAKLLPPSEVELDRKIIFSDTQPRREDYASRTFPYTPAPGDTAAFNEMLSVWFDPENQTRIKWAIGSILSGATHDIHKFYVLYGEPGTGKSSLLKIIRLLFPNETIPFTVSDLTSGTNDFALSVFRDNPLVAIDEEGDLSRVARNSSLNSVVSHDTVLMNLKYRDPQAITLRTTLFVATNKPVRITDVRSGLTRRLIDIVPTGNLLSQRDYEILMGRVRFEIAAIAHECMEVFAQLGRRYLDDYRPFEMMRRTNVLYNFVELHEPDFITRGYITLKEAWALYLAFVEDYHVQYPLPKMEFRDEFLAYWKEYKDQVRIDGERYRMAFVGYKQNVFLKITTGTPRTSWLELEERSSVYDRVFANQPAQLANEHGTPSYSWDDTHTTIADIDTTELHYTLPPSNLVVIDFDIRGPNGQKSLALNVKAASMWPPTYAETSKSGSGIHLHYYYDGDPSTIARLQEEGIEAIAPVGKTSIRRKLYLCNNQPIATLPEGTLALREQKGDNMKVLGSEKALRVLVLRALLKDVHPATKPNVDFIAHILKEAEAQGLSYDIRDLEPRIRSFAGNSTNNAEYCLDLVRSMKFYIPGENKEDPGVDAPDGSLVFFDVEVFPNLFILCYKVHGAPRDSGITLFNPSRSLVADLLSKRLIGFNNRLYDNHILYAWIQGETNEELYHRSRAIIGPASKEGGLIGKAFGISYCDVYNMATTKQSLKAWEVDLGLPYDEMDVDWDAPLPTDMWDRAGEYCMNDTLATEAVFDHLQYDFHARQILAALSGLRINDSTWKHVAKIVFGDDENPQDKFVIPDLSKEFPGYTFDQFAPKKQQSLYRGEYVGEGGYVYAEPGMYRNVAYLDVASMHPTSLVVMNMFGPYTQRFADLKTARVAIRDGRFDEAAKLFDGKLTPFLQDPDEAGRLAYSLKIALNTVYGLTASEYDRPFRDTRNVDNIVAKRGALFMVDLKYALQEAGFKPVHFKTDSVKIADATPEAIEFVMKFGEEYGYSFGVEAMFDRMVLINDAVLVAKTDTGHWEAVGARFAHPYIYKSLFTHEPIEQEDLAEVRSVKIGKIYLKGDSGLTFVGRIGRFLPVTVGGKDLVRVHEGKEYALPGTKGYKWHTYDVATTLGYPIDMSYYEGLRQEAVERIAEFGDPTIFLGE